MSDESNQRKADIEVQERANESVGLWQVKGTGESEVMRRLLVSGLADREGGRDSFLTPGSDQLHSRGLVH